MKHRFEVLQVYSNFAKMVETQFSKRIKIFRSDNALEYTQYAFQAILYSYGTVHHLTCPGTSQQNGKAKQKFRHILDTICALLFSTKVLAHFQDEATLHAVHAINHIPNPVIQIQTPYKRLFGSPPEYHHLCSFGFSCFVLLQPYEHNKLELESRSKLCCFLSYDETQKGYQCYDPVPHRLNIFRNVIFWRHRSFVELSHFRTSLSTSSILDIFPDEPHISSIVTHDPLIDFSVQPPDIFDVSPKSPFNEQVEDEQVKEEPFNPELGSPALAPPEDLAQNILHRHSTQVRSIPAHLLNYHCYIILTTLHEPHTYRETSTNPLWQISMKEELDALSSNHTWDLVTLPPQEIYGWL